MTFSIIVPIYNRPDEAAELLQSLSEQTFWDFELVLVEDGSTKPCAPVVEQFRSKITIHYIAKENTGRSDSRNTGMAYAKGDFFIFFDSDCIIPPTYLEVVNNLLLINNTDCYGGPDKEHATFSPIQKAINYTMTSFWTTGGIRGCHVKNERFEPRTFNMGFSRRVYETVGGFLDMFGEDIELSNRIRRAGFSIQLFPEAFVYHKRRVNLRRFYKQVFIFGQARINVHKLHPGSLRFVHTLPALAILMGVIFLSFAFVVTPCILYLPAIYVFLLFFDSLIKTKNLQIAGLSLFTAAIQIIGYGTGFIRSFVKKVIFRKGLEKRDELNKMYK